MKINMIGILSLVLLLGAFLYLFEIFYHGAVQEDFNKIQITLTFLVLLLGAGLLFGYQILENKLKKKDLVKAFLFLGLTIAFLFLIFYTRDTGTLIPLFFSIVYFAAAVFVLLKKSMEFKDPLIRFAFRFFIVIGLMILPVAAIEYVLTGSVDFKLDAIYMPLISIITFITSGALNMAGFSTQYTPLRDGYTLALTDGSYRVFIGAFCSGITSMSVFIAAFIAMAMDLKANVFKKAMLFGIGILGTFIANLMRVLLLFLVGYYFGKDALISVHTHLGWILFFIWITIFWIFALKFADDK